MKGDDVKMNGVQLRERRKKSRITQREIADRIGVSRALVCLIEKGKRHNVVVEREILTLIRTIEEDMRKSLSETDIA